VRIEPLDPVRDLDAVVAIEAASFTNPWTREMLASELEHSDLVRVWVARADEGPIVAFCSAWIVLDELHIHTLAVDPRWRRRGYGRALLDHVLREGTRAGARRATLEVRESNVPARRLYEQAGFVVRARRPGYYERPSEDALILWRELVREDAADRA
jgi:ribosomal-protein-alanine N-acetyltransferase